MQRELRRFIMKWSIIATLFLLVMSCTGIVAAPCPTDVSREWVVNDTASATALAKAINCSGGVFNVQWRGSVVVDRPLYVMDGTHVHVVGAGSGASIDGGGNTQLFNVVNASLNVSNMQLENGIAVAAVGGAIASDGSRISFHETSFIGNTAEYGGAVHVDGSAVSWAAGSSFYNNTASSSGGAVYVDGGSSASWAAETSFYNNTASSDGGAMYVDGGSSASWEAQASFFSNTAGWVGGAVYVQYGSNAFWAAKTSFYNNTAARHGGAMYVDGGSSASWETEASFSGNTAGWDGGAVYVFDGSNASWAAETSFYYNTAGWGGAVHVDGSAVSWAAGSSFYNNTASATGGAVYLDAGSSASWAAKTSFFSNTASLTGGAVYLDAGSSAFWAAKTSFYNNAGWEGGAVYLDAGSSASWAAETSFYYNTAGWKGGAMYVSSGSSASWEAEASFSGNTADREGGAVYVYDGSNASWAGKTSFYYNTAGESGGALFVCVNSRASWEADTDFLHNQASRDGGAVCITDDKESRSTLLMNGSTMFLNNRCGAGGGGISMTGAVSINFLRENVTFSGNTAAVSGGAVSVIGVEFGPHFLGLKFVSNAAEIGGGVYVAGSGTGAIVSEWPYPTTFDGCKFIGNEAAATGGAVDSASGRDFFKDTLFEGNSARVGGALRLAGTATLQNCTFVENTSDKDEGPAVSNIGSIDVVHESSFVDNVFECEPGMFLNLSQSGDIFGIVCSGCTSCSHCKSHGEIPSCTSTMEHSTSPGGTITLEMLLIDAGYWRATNTSTDVLACYNADACLGNKVTGATDYCQDGFGGPYCSICSKGYTVSLGFSCSKCSDNTGGVVLLVFALLAMIAFAAFISYMMSVEEEGADRGIVAGVTRYIPLQSLKMVIVAWQILTQFSRVANVAYPDVYQEFLDGVDVLNFDLSWIFSTGCIFDVDFHARLLLSTIGPLIGASVLGATYLVAVRRQRGSCSSGVGIVRQKHLSMVLLLTFVVYSSVSSTSFQMFACETLDDGKYYLRADYRIECDSSRHEALQIYAGFMIVVYTVGIPVFYATLLFRNRDVLTDGDGRKVDERVKSVTDLWKPYKPDRFYYEVIECFRRILLTGVVVFIYPDTAPQVAVTILISGFFMIVSEALAPFESKWNTWVSRMGHAIVFLSMYMALLLKVDLSNELANSQRIFEVILVSAHACMISAVIIESIVLACALRSQKAHPQPRFRGGGKVSFFALRAEDDAAEDIPRPHYVDDVETEPNMDQRKENQSNRPKVCFL